MQRLQKELVKVALFVSAWIEISGNTQVVWRWLVALFVSAWIEIAYLVNNPIGYLSRTLCECVDWNQNTANAVATLVNVALFVSAWIEIIYFW